MAQLVSANPKHPSLNGRNLPQGAVEQGPNQVIQIVLLLNAPVQEGVVVHRVGFVKTTQIAREAVDVLGRVLPHQMLVERLEGKLTCARARALGWRFARTRGAGFRAHPSCSKRRAISIATRAASRPLSC